MLREIRPAAHGVVEVLGARHLLAGVGAARLLGDARQHGADRAAHERHAFPVVPPRAVDHRHLVVQLGLEAVADVALPVRHHAGGMPDQAPCINARPLLPPEDGERCERTGVAGQQPQRLIERLLGLEAPAPVAQVLAAGDGEEEAVSQPRLAVLGRGARGLAEAGRHRVSGSRAVPGDGGTRPTGLADGRRGLWDLEGQDEREHKGAAIPSPNVGALDSPRNCYQK